MSGNVVAVRVACSHCATGHLATPRNHI